MNFKQRASLIVAVLMFSYVYVLPRWADWNQNSRLNLVRALSEQGIVSIDRYASNTGDYAVYAGRSYSDKAPGPAFLALPAALAARPLLDQPIVEHQLRGLASSGAFASTLNPTGSGFQIDKVRAFVVLLAAALWTAAIPSALGAVALWSLLRRLGTGEGPALFVTLAYGLATTLATYAGNFYSHALVASLLVAAWAVAAYPSAAARGLLIGLLLGWAVISEYPAALPALLIGLAAAWAWRKLSALAWVALGGLAPVLLMALYDWIAFGTPVPIGYEHSALWQQQHQTGFVSLTYPHLDALAGLNFGLYRGLFVRSPWLLLALPGYVLWWRSDRARSDWWVAVLAPLSVLLVYSSSVMWWGGFAAGPRYVVAAIPFLAVASAPAVERLWTCMATRGLLAILVGASMALTWAEAVARQGFPPDTIANPWIAYTIPAWRDGDIARNLGTALGLHGALSLLPLIVLLAGALAYSLSHPRPTNARPPLSAGDMEGQTIAPFQH
jgi:hypothetical protein